MRGLNASVLCGDFEGFLRSVPEMKTILKRLIKGQFCETVLCEESSAKSSVTGPCDEFALVLVDGIQFFTTF